MRNKGKEAMAKTPYTQGSAPRLRFPGFEGKWQLVPLSRLASRSTLRNSDEKVKRVLTNSAEFGILDQRDYFDKDIANKGNLQNYYVVQKGDFVYNPRVSMSAPVGPISQNEIGIGVMSPLYTVFRFHALANGFFAQFFHSGRWHGFLRANSSTGARHDRMSIGADTFMQMPAPDIAQQERQQIANCLSSLDDRIRAENHKIAALESHKHALMQQLFPSEGESLPRLRFPGFHENWECRLLGNVAPLQRGFDLPSSELRSGEIPVVYSNGVKNSHDSGMATGPGIVTGRSGTIGKIHFIPNGDYWPHNTSLWVTDFCGNDPLYTFYLLAFVGMGRFASGSGVPTLNRNDVHAFSVFIPDLREQRAIAAFLSSLDELIALQSQKIASFERHKKGMLQGLFPAMDSQVE